MGLSPRHYTDRATVELVGRAAARVVRLTGLGPSDHDDVRQDLMLQLVRRAPQYDPRRGTPRTFVGTVVHSGATDLVRRYRAKQRRLGRRVYLGDEDAALIDPKVADQDLRIDVRSALEKLPRHLRGFADALREHGNVVSSGRLCGLTRARARALTSHLRDHFVGLRPGCPGRAAA